MEVDLESGSDENGVAPEKSLIGVGNAEDEEGEGARVVGSPGVEVHIDAVGLSHHEEALVLFREAVGEVVEEVDAPGVVGLVLTEPGFEVVEGGDFGERAVDLPGVEVAVLVEDDDAVGVSWGFVELPPGVLL